MKKKIIPGIVFIILMGHLAYPKKENKFLARGQGLQMIYDLMLPLPKFEKYDECTTIFKDIPSSHPNCKAITYSIQIDIYPACFPSQFKPDNFLSKYETAILFQRVMYKIARDYEIKFPYSTETLMKFSDLPDDKDICDAVLKVADMGIIQGYPSNTKKSDGLYSDPEMKKPMPLSEAKKYFAIIRATTEKLLKEKGLTLKGAK